MPQANVTIPVQLRPDPSAVAFDLDRALKAVVGLKCEIPEDAFTAQILGTERAGNGVLVDASGLILTIGYLITEAETIWITTADGQVIPGHALGYDQETGFGLVQAFRRIDLPVLPLGSSDSVAEGAAGIVAGYGGLKGALAVRVVAKQEFAGYWEYLLDEAFFTAPAHPFWGGSALIDGEGQLVGIGSLRIEHTNPKSMGTDINMVVPIDLLKPILPDLRRYGRTQKPPRPWLGMYAIEKDGRLVVAGLSDDGPADKAGVKAGDVVHAINGETIHSSAELYKNLWSSGEPGTVVRLAVTRGAGMNEIAVTTGNRASFLKRPKMH
jgi:S1-C subfamily serine protease